MNTKEYEPNFTTVIHGFGPTVYIVLCIRKCHNEVTWMPIFWLLWTSPIGNDVVCKWLPERWFCLPLCQFGQYSCLHVAAVLPGRGLFLTQWGTCQPPRGHTAHLSYLTGYDHLLPSVFQGIKDWQSCALFPVAYCQKGTMLLATKVCNFT